MEVVEAPAHIRDDARHRFEEALNYEQRRHDSSSFRNRLRKIRTARGIEGLPPDLRAVWDEEVAWFSRVMAGFRDWPLSLQIDEVVCHGAPAGQATNTAYAAAAIPLLTWWEQHEGKEATCTKFGKTKPSTDEQQMRSDGNVYTPSSATLFLAIELTRIDPNLAILDQDGTDSAIQKAFAACRHYQKVKVASRRYHKLKAARFP